MNNSNTTSTNATNATDAAGVFSTQTFANLKGETVSLADQLSGKFMEIYNLIQNRVPDSQYRASVIEELRGVWKNLGQAITYNSAAAH